MDTKEKEQEKVSTPEVKESPAEETKQDKSEPKVESKSEPISEKSDKSEDVIKSLQGQISKLQKELNEKTDIKTQLKSMLGEDTAESDVDPVEALNSRLQTLESQLVSERAENAKNNYIDGLDQPEAVKRHLKKIVKANTEELESVVEEELKSVSELLANVPPKATDFRPKGIGATNADTTNMDYVLSHPELFKK